METISFLKQSMRMVALANIVRAQCIQYDNIICPLHFCNLNLTFTTAILKGNFSSSENQTTAFTDEPTELEKKFTNYLEHVLQSTVVVDSTIDGKYRNLYQDFVFTVPMRRCRMAHGDRHDSLMDTKLIIAR